VPTFSVEVDVVIGPIPTQPENKTNGNILKIVDLKPNLLVAPNV
jgi:hypothetical protein